MTEKVLFCGAWDEGPGYPRATALRQALAAQGVRIGEVRARSLGQKKQQLVRQPWRWPLFLLQQLWQQWRFKRRLQRALVAQRPDVVVVPYPGHLWVRQVRAVTDVPVVLDLFLSAFDTTVGDRGLFAAGSFRGKLMKALDRRACAAADLVLLDTEEQAAHLAELLAMPSQRFGWLPVADPEAPRATEPYRPFAGPLRLLFFGTGVPLHGLDTLIAAVAAAPDVRLTLIGGSAEHRTLAQQRLGPRLCLGPEFVPRRELQQHLDACELVAGVFGSSPKAGRVVPFKVVHALASGRPVITADHPAVRRFLKDGTAAFLVRPGDSVALAQRLQELAHDRLALAAAAAQARSTYDRCFLPATTGARLCARLDALQRRSP
jgi:glycosyltransferase involved in cell wall biosynthesis